MFDLTKKTKAYLLLSGVLLLFGGLAVYALQGGFSDPPPRAKRLRVRWAGDVDAKASWVPTSITVEADEELRISASGIVTWAKDVAPPNAMVDPNGAPWSPRNLTPVADTPQNRFPDPGAKCGSLVARIGNSVYGVGTGASIAISEPGPLAFMVNSRFGWLYQNSGSFHVEASVYPPLTEIPPPKMQSASLWISGAGALLVLLVLVLPRAERKDNQLMKLPDDWNDLAIDKAITAASPNMLGSLLERISRTFIMGQEIEVAKKRIEHLTTFLKLADLERQTYSWRQAIKNKLVEQEEQAKVDALHRKQRIEKLRNQAEEEKLLTEIALSKKTRADLNKVETPALTPAVLSTEEKRKQQRIELEERERRLKDHFSVRLADPTLSIERRKQLENERHDELAKLETEARRLI